MLSEEEKLLTSGTLIPKSALTGLPRNLWLLAQIQALITEWQPGMLVYEGFIWWVGDEGEHFVKGRPAMERLIGGIQCLSLMPPYPVLVEMLPSQWGSQLCGSKSHTKQQIAFAVNCRLDTTYQGSHFDNHEVDSIGIALVALDNMKAQRYQALNGVSW